MIKNVWVRYLAISAAFFCGFSLCDYLINHAYDWRGPAIGTLVYLLLTALEDIIRNKKKKNQQQ